MKNITCRTVISCLSTVEFISIVVVIVGVTVQITLRGCSYRLLDLRGGMRNEALDSARQEFVDRIVAVNTFRLAENKNCSQEVKHVVSLAVRCWREVGRAIFAFYQDTGHES